ncbi:hypothetical protein [Herbidospora cretacea]|uniref:hypothetical protein n=1 Tax=Herbidospora cretacea TaxID=28444 RepID=UPI000ACBDA2D|nr:hypothetical protein [Herbidospora cretacea]
MPRMPWRRRLRYTLILAWALPLAAVQHVLVRLGLLPGLPVPLRHPDGAVTVHGAAHGFPPVGDAAPHEGWQIGFLTVHRDRVAFHPLPGSVECSFPREGAVVTVDWPGRGVLKLGASARVRVELPDGRVFLINLRTAYQEVVEDLAGRPLGRRAAGS